MAIYINIKKVEENNESAEYAFGTSEDKLGKLKIYKSTGEIIIVENVPNDDGGVYQRASHKIKKHWLSGELPQITCWAS